MSVWCVRTGVRSATVGDGVEGLRALGAQGMEDENIFQVYIIYIIGSGMRYPLGRKGFAKFLNSDYRVFSVWTQGTDVRRYKFLYSRRTLGLHRVGLSNYLSICQ